MLALALALSLSAAQADAPAEVPAAETPAPAPAVDPRVDELTASKPTVWGPLFATIMGAVVVFWGGYIGVVGWAMSGQRYWFAGGGVIAALGLALDAVGIVRMVSAVRQRREIDRQIEALTPVEE